MNPQEEKDILTYLEGEITNNKGFIAINGINIESIFNSTDKQNMFIDFAITALINERERMKEHDGLSDQKIDQLLENINYYSEGYNGYEYGVPIFGEHVNNLREIVRKSLITPKKKKK